MVCKKVSNHTLHICLKCISESDQSRASIAFARQILHLTLRGTFAKA